jgi:hypothetical protein
LSVKSSWQGESSRYHMRVTEKLDESNGLVGHVFYWSPSGSWKQVGDGPLMMYHRPDFTKRTWKRVKKCYAKKVLEQ